MNPRFCGENLTHNLGLVETLREIANRKGCSVAQLAIAWVLAQGADVIPLVGARRRERLDESLGALDVSLSDADLAELVRAIPRDAAAGARYAPAQMAMLDSEKAMVRA
jgi:aryl-alcohol dehydrogenase-like predicted oxidoreductase